jgi:hypothetical protein
VQEIELSKLPYAAIHPEPLIVFIFLSLCANERPTLRFIFISYSYCTTKIWIVNHSLVLQMHTLVVQAKWPLLFKRDNGEDCRLKHGMDGFIGKNTTSPENRPTPYSEITWLSPCSMPVGEPVRSVKISPARSRAALFCA